MSDITKLSIEDLRKGLSSKDFSAVEITKDFLKRANYAANELNSFITLTEEKALQEAALADKKIANNESAPLLGIPVGIKDVVLTKGIRTTCGSKILDNFIPPYDATVTKKLLDAGAVSLGKLNMDEFAMGGSNENSAFGAVKNPWNPSYVPGGSSGGSAAAVAYRAVAASLGSDTGGSIRQPAAFCNLVGIKPTYGRVSRYGVIAFASSLDQIGPFGKNVKDAATMLDVVSGFDPNDSTSMNRQDGSCMQHIGKDIKGLKIGIPKEYFVDGIDADVLGSVKAAIKQLENLGAIPVEVSLPHTEAAISVYYIIAPAEASSNLARYDGIRFGHRAKDTKNLSDLYAQSRSEGFGDEVKRRIIIGTYVLSSGYYDAFYSRAQKVRTLMIQDFNNAFSQCDAIVCPTTPTGPFPIGDKSRQDPLQMYLGDAFTIPVNLAGLPGLSLPCGADKNGLPVGLQLIGKAWDEAKLLQLAYAYEQSTNWHKKFVE
jgi:aspartyl-tRNA(Asn)/glutamyl-tRNA(Gln) amidotransferase subunit A